MKPYFHHRAINGPFEDPSVYCRLLRERRALLFDAGWLGGLGQGRLLRITDVFVTHAHIDHFIGFDTLLRALLRREAPLRIYGPGDMADRVEGKLAGYQWNLIEQYPLRIEVHSVGADEVSLTSFSAADRFRRREMGMTPFTGVVLDEPSFRVSAVSLRHDIQCMGYCLEETVHINIDKDALLRTGLAVGPWLSVLKDAVRQGLPDDAPIEAGGRTFMLGQLRALASVSRGQKISYIADTSPDDENVRRVVDLVRGSDTLYCEAYFLDADRERASSRNHLTAALAGRIAREAGVKALVPMHFSPRYKDSEYTPYNEAMTEFRGPG